MSKSIPESLVRKLQNINIDKYNSFIYKRPLDSIEDTFINQYELNKSLSGLVGAVKDNFSTKGEPTTCASQILKDYISPFDSTAVELLERNGCTLVGKTNLDEFGMGGANVYSNNGITLNPLYEDEKRVAGGSSGGSAAAVKSFCCDFALGTDTGGSIRLPGAYCGIYGFKPSYGRISRWGVVAYAQSLDTVGILANKIQTVSKVFNVLDKEDNKDPTCLDEISRNTINSTSDQLPRDFQSINIGISKYFLAKGTSNEMLESLKQLFGKLFEELKCNIIPIDIVSLKNIVPVYFTIAYSEAASNLARYDGIRYGTLKLGEDYKSTICKTRSSGFGTEVKKRILIGNYNLSSEKFQHNLMKAQSLRNEMRNEFNCIFRMPNVFEKNKELNNNGIDFIIAPVSTTKAPTIEEYLNLEANDPISTYVNDAYVIPSSLAGLPSISVPWKTSDDKYPGAVQIIGQYGDDRRLLWFVEELQKRFHQNIN